MKVRCAQAYRVSVSQCLVLCDGRLGLWIRCLVDQPVVSSVFPPVPAMPTWAEVTAHIGVRGLTECKLGRQCRVATD